MVLLNRREVAVELKCVETYCDLFMITRETRNFAILNLAVLNFKIATGYFKHNDRKPNITE